MNITEGQVFAERYRLNSRIAIGGMGEVWRGQDLVLGRDVAVKVLKPEYTGDQEFLTRFRNEARHTAALSHPNIAAVWDYGETQSAAFLVMELVHGHPLSEILHREAPLPVHRAMNILAQAARGLHAAHLAGVIHRDVKPGNLLITNRDDVKVTDFGIARAADQLPLTRTGQVMGTAQYLAPEQAMGHPSTPASDVYSLAVVGYEMLTGGRLFSGDSPVTIAMAHVNTPAPELPAHFPAGARQLISSALNKDPERRPASAEEFAKAAEAIAAGRDDLATSILGGAAMMGMASRGYAAPTAATTALAPPPGMGTMGPYGGSDQYDPYDGYDQYDEEPPKKKSWWGPIIGALVLVAAIVAGVLALNGGKDDPAPNATTSPKPTTASATTASPTPTETPTTTKPTTSSPTKSDVPVVEFDKNTVIGMRKADAVLYLENMGLKAKIQTKPSRPEKKDEVIDVSVDGTVPKGSTVILVVGDGSQTPKPTTTPPGETLPAPPPNPNP